MFYAAPIPELLFAAGFGVFIAVATALLKIVGILRVQWSMCVGMVAILMLGSALLVLVADQISKAV